MPELLEQPPDTQLVAPKRRYRRFSVQDAELIAGYVAKRFTEAEACEIEGISIHSWYHWKQDARHNSKYAQVLERVRGSYIKARFEQIEDVAAGRGVKYPDWRAAAHLLGLVAPDRYGQQSRQEQAPVVHNTTVNVLIEQLYSQPKALAHTPTCSNPKHITDGSISVEAQVVEVKQ